ncbi:MAG: inositol monophosphatase [Lachnospiraceae bacterium]|nr:inositol monophosphatase [Lachnospiraceae bacterium]
MDKILEDIGLVARKAGKIMLEASNPKVMEKSGHANFCTETDEKIQAFLIDNLSSICPEASFLGEEDGQDVFTAKMSRGFCFVIDPIDGTSNFIFAYRPSVISIALLKDGRPYLGVVYNPFDEMMFTAQSGKGAYLNGEPVMSSKAPLSESLTVFGTAPYYEELRDQTFDAVKKLMPLCVDVRRSGTAAWDMCCVACGRCSLYFELKIQLWDYAAGALIASEAGCSVADIEGKPLSYSGASSIVCISQGIRQIPDIF